MGEFVIFESDTAAAEVEWFRGFGYDLFADIIVVTYAVVGDDKSVGSELELRIGTFYYVAFFDEIRFGHGGTNYFIVDLGWKIVYEESGTPD